MNDDSIAQLADQLDRLLEGRGSPRVALPDGDPLEVLSDRINALAARLPGGPADRSLFSHGPVVVFRWRNDEGWPVEFVSDNVEDLTGYPSAEFASDRRPYASLIHPDDIERVTAEVVEHSASKPWFEHQPYRIRRQDGRELWIYDYTVVIKDDDGSPTHFYGYIMDISERVATDELIRQQVSLIDSLGAPIVQLWEGVLTVPIMGLLTDARAKAVTEALLHRVSQTQTRTIIVDLTGVESIDTSTVLHLHKLSRAVSMLGCECVLTGISPSIAQTMVSLDVGFDGRQVYRTLAAALRQIMKR